MEENIKDYFLNPDNAEYFKHKFHDMIDRGIDFVTGDTVLNYADPETLINIVKGKFPEDGASLESIIQFYETKLLPYSINQANSRYIAFPDAGNTVAGYMADIIKPFINQNLIADIRSAPIGTYMEIQILQRMRQLVGYSTAELKKSEFPESISEVGGMYCYGGVMTIVTAILIARCKLLNGSFTTGLGSAYTDQDQYYILVPAHISHYSASVAMGYLGLGSNNVIQVALNKDFTMNTNALQETISELMHEGSRKRVIAVIGYAGDSRTMRIDKFFEINDICKKYNIRFHIDACHGGSLLFSNDYRSKLSGVELSDSISIDPHKTLSIPYPSSIFLTSDPKDMLLIAKNYDMTITSDSFDLGQITPFIGSKSFESLKLWTLINYMGKRKIGQMVDKRVAIANHFKYLIDTSDDFVSLHDVNINSLCFYYFPEQIRKEYESTNNSEQKQELIKELDQKNKMIEKSVYKRGYTSIHSFKLPDIGNRAGLQGTGERQVLGVIFGNYLTTIEDVESCFHHIQQAADNLFNL